METNKEIEKILELEKNARSLKDKQRSVALDYTKKIIHSFGFTSEELFTENRFRNGALERLRELFAQDVGISRKDFISKAVALGVSKATAGTQYSIIQRANNAI